jgi:OOP family OmpA-OmpF porin
MHPSSRPHALFQRQALTLAVLALSPGLAPAQTPEAPYLYLGLGMGQTRPRLDAPRLGRQVLTGTGLTITGTGKDERDTAYKAFVGYQFNRHLGLEVGYFRLGHFSYVATTSPAGQLDGRLRVTGVNLDLVAQLPITDSLSALARVGYQKARTRADWTGTGAVTGADRNGRANENDGRYGLGLQYALTPQFLARAEAGSSRFADALGGTVRAVVYSVSLVMPLGTSAAPMRRASAPAPAMAPAPVVAASPPPPVVPAPVAMLPLPPAPVPVQRVSFAAESLFGFDSAQLQPEGRTALDSFARSFAGARLDTIAVTGHTDRLGTAAYNLTLSLQRADAVKDYLVGTAHLDANRITTEGRGEADPVTQPGDCKGVGSKRVIACLQPDRRVDIQVSATR